MDINEALKKLQEKETIFSYIDKQKTYFKMINDKIIVKNSSMGFQMSSENFLELFKNNSFEVHDDNEEFIDPKKDEEYYSWRNK